MRCRLAGPEGVQLRSYRPHASPAAHAHASAVYSPKRPLARCSLLARWRCSSASCSCARCALRIPLSRACGTLVQLALREGGIARGDRSGVAVLFVAAELRKCLLILIVGVSLPILQVHAIDVARISVGESGLTRDPVHFLACVEVALIFRAQLGCLSHEPNLSAGLIGQVWKACGAVAGGKIALGTGRPKWTYSFKLLSLLLALDLSAELAQDGGKNLFCISRVNGRGACRQKCKNNGRQKSHRRSNSKYAPKVCALNDVSQSHRGRCSQKNAMSWGRTLRLSPLLCSEQQRRWNFDAGTCTASSGGGVELGDVRLDILAVTPEPKGAV